MMTNKYDAAPVSREEPDERRRAHRLLCADLITVHWGTGRGTARREAAVIEDYSPTGASLSIEAKIDAGAAVTIITAGESFRASVRRCDRREHGYLLGIEFDKPRGEQDAFIPDHLLDPCELEP
jgi:hypothetical protein